MSACLRFFIQVYDHTEEELEPTAAAAAAEL